MKINFFQKLFLILVCIVFTGNAFAQSGGPPMLTDDPGVVDLHKFELNTSINTSVTNLTQIAIPYIDANYGIAKNIHFKIEFPYNFNLQKHQRTTSSFGDLMIGLKCKFFDEEKYFLSAGTYPQWTVTGDEKGFFIPLLLEKTFGKFLIGEDFGIFWGENKTTVLSNGILLGYKVSEKFEVMGEYFLEKQTHPFAATDGYMNYGFRYSLNSHINFMGSFGTQIVTASQSDKQYFFSWLGIQTSF
jgi:hypothetical protein